MAPPRNIRFVLEWNSDCKAINFYVTGLGEVKDCLMVMIQVPSAGNGLEVTQADLLSDLKKQLDKAVAQAGTDPFGFGFPWATFDTTSHGAGLVVFGLFAVAFCGLAILRGPDASWDLRNYHIYNAYAVLNHRFGYDLFPAQLQTFHAPMLDLLYEGTRIAFNAHPKALSALLALPQAVAAFLAYRITLVFVPASLPARELLAFVTVVIGASGAAGLPTLASPASEMVPAAMLWRHSSFS